MSLSFTSKHLSMLPLILAVVLLVSSNAHADANRFFEDAQAKLHLGEVEAAIVQLKNALEQTPNHAPARVLLGRAYLRLGDGAGAEAQFRTAQTLGASASNVEPFLAAAYLLQFRYRELIAELHNRHDLSNDARSSLLIARGQAFVALGMTDEAVQSFSQARDINTNSEGPLLGLASVALRIGELGKAQSAIKQALEIDPNSAGALNLMASVSHARGDLEAAARDYAQALQHDPAHLDARVARAGVLMDLGRQDAAQQELDYLNEHFPADPRAGYLRAVLLARNGDKDAAQAVLQSAEQILESITPEIYEGRPQLLLLRGLVNYSLGRYESAQAPLEHYIRRMPKDVSARKILASAFGRIGEHLAALEVLKVAYELSPDDSELLSMLGTAYVQIGQPERAVAIFEKAVRLARPDGKAGIQLAFARLAAGERESAMRELASLLDAGAEQSEIGIALVMLHLKGQQTEQALSVAKKLASRYPNQAMAINALGTAQAAAGRSQAARESFNKVLSLQPDFRPARMNLVKLDRLDGRAEAARKQLDAILIKEPENRRAMMELALLEESHGRFDAVNRWLTRASDGGLEGIPALLALAAFHLRQGDLKAALSATTEAEKRAPTDPRVLDSLATVLTRSGDRAGALDVLRRLRRIAKQIDMGSDALYRIAMRQSQLHGHEDAVATLEAAELLEPNKLAVKVALIETLIGLGDLPHAQRRAAALRAQRPDQAIAHGLLADALASQGRYSEAEAGFARAQELAPSSRWVVAHYQSLWRGGKRDQAVVELQRWLAGHPDDVLARRALAEGMLILGKADTALEQFEILELATPNDASLLNNLAYLHDRTGSSKSMAYARRAYELAPEDPAVNDTLGWLLVRQRQFEDGIKYLREANTRAGNSGEIRYHIAVALAGLDRWAEARVELEHALSDGAQFEGIEFARKLWRRIEAML